MRQVLREGKFSDHRTERGGRADPSQGDAGDPDDRRRARCVDARAVGRGQGIAAAIAGS